MRLALIALSSLLMANAYAADLVLTNELELSEETMDSSRGGQYVIDIDSVTASSEIAGLSAGNTALNTVNGDNVIAAGALAASSGVTSVIQNTGNNVLIQNSMVVNLTLK
ncbi:carbon storage regulator [Vibrio sinensis]|uniref:Carbon storage regulator n=1 Tax=Vibrio sinensis TaxID=2302434 RepID=A0A3A6QSJ1_9VIBR|nr:carbon storage regulator [Vibrio sinensis]RJX75745.1 carbon storage regulator [Vibrio sinensis]